jgi:arylsulfatase A-like enzyme
MVRQPIVLLVADSLRYDTVWARGDHRLPWMAARSVRFHQARSAGCWTLPATASMFTGLLPHEHGATELTRRLRPVPTLAERMVDAGHRAHMVTANVATTEVFGLDRGFQSVDRVWQQVPARHRRLHQFLALAGKPRLREKLFSTDYVMGRLSEDLEMAKTWLQDTDEAVFDAARRRLREAAAAGAPAFLFLNLMETHFPYHVADTFETLATTPWQAVRELMGLYHLVNMTWMTDDRTRFIPDDVMATLRRRQRLAWERLAPRLDAFAQELVEEHGAWLAIGSDHGETFGEHGHSYHFANIHDAGNRVPWFVLDARAPESRDVHTPVSTRDLYGTALRAAGIDDGAVDLLSDPARSVSVTQACWYDHRGHTLDRYRRHQVAFVDDGTRYAWRGDRWWVAPTTCGDEAEPAWQPLPFRADPLRDGVLAPEVVGRVAWHVEGFRRFAAALG